MSKTMLPFVVLREKERISIKFSILGTVKGDLAWRNYTNLNGISDKFHNHMISTWHKQYPR